MYDLVKTINEIVDLIMNERKHEADNRFALVKKLRVEQG
jgi:hypothetical protein